MVLGIRSKSRKRVSIQVQYMIRVQEIKPWPPSQSLRSVQSVLLQWENGDQISGSLASTAGVGKIEFNESFRLSVLMWREESKKSKHHESFQKNYLEFSLYDKTVKSQLLGSATINFADFGIIKETKALRILLNCKKSSKNSSQPLLYFTIQPFDAECSSSSPSSSLSKELSLDKEGSESLSQSLKDDDDVEIATFTDDDSDEVRSNTSQTMRSASTTTGGNIKIKGGAEGSHGEFVLPSESTTSSLVGNTKSEASTQFNGIKSPSSSTVLGSDMGNVADGSRSLPKISEETVKLADASSEIRESIQQSSDSCISSSMQPNFERPFQSQVTQENSMIQEDGTRDERLHKDDWEKDSSVSDLGDMADGEKIEEGRKGQKQFIERNQLLENELNNFSDDDSTMKGSLNSSTLLLNEKPHEHPRNVLMNDKTEDMDKEKMEEGRKGQKQFTEKNEHSENELNKFSHDDSKMKGSLNSTTILLNKKPHDHSRRILMNDKTEDEDKEKMEEGRKGQKQFPERNESLEDEFNNFSDDDSTKKGNLNNTTILPNKKQDEHPRSILMNDKTEDEDREKMEEERKGEKQFPERNESLENEFDNFSDDDSTKKGNLNNTTILPNEKQDEHPRSILMNEKTEDEDKDKMEDERKGQKQFLERNESLEDEFNNFSDDDSTKKGNLNSTAILPNKKQDEHSRSILMNDKTEDEDKEKMEEERKGEKQFPERNESLEDEFNNFSDDDSTKKGNLNNTTTLPNQKQDEHPRSILMNDETEDEDKEKMEEGRKGQKQFTERNELLENELNNLSDNDSTKKGNLNTTTLLLNKKPQEDPRSTLMNDKTEDVANVKVSLLSAENYGQINNQTHNQEEEINTMNDVHVGTACHEDINASGSFLNNKTELKAEVEMLRGELREAAALEVSMYSVIAEHGSSSNKVHAPARRLSRFYFHACRVGSPATIASAAQSAVSGFVLVSKACGNDVPRLTFWFSNLILLKAIVSKEVQNIHSGVGSCINSKCDAIDNTLHEEVQDNTEPHFLSWEDPKTFLVALEKVEAWIFSRIVESVWWQTLTPYMQSAAAKSSSFWKAYERRPRVGDQDQGNFSIDLWKRAFKDACERLCPLRTGGLECGCLSVIARLVMEQLVSRLDVAMFNAILRESAEEMPMDPVSDPISDSRVLPIPAGKSSFGAGAQLKNAVGDWSRWLSDLFSIDDSDSFEVSNENDEPKCESSFKPFLLLNALSDLMMLPLDMLADGSTRKEVCPRFGISLIKRVVNNFVPDEFSPGPIPDAVFDALNNEDTEDDEEAITNLPCSAGSTFYAPLPASSILGMLQEVGTKFSLRSGSFGLKKLYTSDDELDKLDSPLTALGMDELSFSSKEKFAQLKGGRKVVRYELLREVWKGNE